MVLDLGWFSFRVLYEYPTCKTQMQLQMQILQLQLRAFSNDLLENLGRGINFLKQSEYKLDGDHDIAACCCSALFLEKPATPNTAAGSARHLSQEANDGVR